MISQKQIVEEYRKCYQDKTRIYMIENYLTTYDATQNNIVPFKLFPRQKVFLGNMCLNINNITSKPRQSGVTSTISARFASEAALATEEQPENILIIANNLDLAKENLTKIKDFLLQLPRWFWGEEYYGSPEKEEKSIFIKANEKQLVLCNGSKVYARSSKPSSSRGLPSITRLLFDEASFIETPETITSAISTTASSGKSICYVSTPYGKDAIYYPVYSGAKKGENSFTLTEFRWYQDPRYNKHLKWNFYDKKTGEEKIYVEPILNSQGDIEYNEQHWEDMVQQNYTPTGPWYEKMCATYNYDKQKIAQELDVSFQGSSGTVIDSEIIEYHEKTNTRQPLYTDNFYKEAWIYREPIENHKYIMTIDVSTGSGDDSSVIHILDVDYIDEKGHANIEQVFEYQGKIQGDILGELAEKYGVYYGNALAVVDCIGSSGDACVLKLQSLNYPNLYYDDPNLKNVTVENNGNNYNEILEKKMPGFRASSVRMQMLMNLEKMLRFNEITPRSKRFTQELTTFIWKNGRPDHQSGYHDDTITSMAMGLYILEFSFKKLQAVKEKTKAILSSMILAQNIMSNHADLNLQAIKENKIPLPFYTGKTLNAKLNGNAANGDPNKMLNIMGMSYFR